MSRHAREIKLMLEGSINNSEGHRDQYQVYRARIIYSGCYSKYRKVSSIVPVFFFFFFCVVFPRDPSSM